jgi:hypothetical protein
MTTTTDPHCLGFCSPLRHAVLVTTGLEVAALKWVADLLKSLLAAAGGDRLKKNRLSSSERASQAANKLYVSLNELAEASKDFVEILTAIAEGESGARGALEWALQRAAKASNNVAEAVNQINPQLSIHAPDIARNIEHAPTQRGMRISSAKEAAALYDYTSQEQGTAAFREVAQGAQQTLTEIEAATESLRKFLAEQFKFTENF